MNVTFCSPERHNNRLDRTPACDGLQTDRQMDILPQHSPRYAYALHTKNCQSLEFCL